jgi:hypothetical protein
MYDQGMRIPGIAAFLLACLACAGAPRGAARLEPAGKSAGKKAGTMSESQDLSRIDHVLVGIDDLQAGIDQLERLTGVRAVIGGAHPGRGTRNALISLGGSHYLEILSPNPEEPGNAEADGLRGLTTLKPIAWAVRTDDPAALQARLRSEGLQVGEVRPGGRNLPDGSRLAWRTLGFAAPSSPLLPFFIAWEPGSPHPSATSPAGCRLTGFSLQDPNPQSLRQPLQAAGLTVEVREGKEPGLRIALACRKGDVELQ